MAYQKFSPKVIGNIICAFIHATTISCGLIRKTHRYDVINGYSILRRLVVSVLGWASPCIYRPGS